MCQKGMILLEMETMNEVSIFSAADVEQWTLFGSRKKIPTNCNLLFAS